MGQSFHLYIKVNILICLAKLLTTVKKADLMYEAVIYSSYFPDIPSQLTQTSQFKAASSPSLTRHAQRCVTM